MTVYRERRRRTILRGAMPKVTAAHEQEVRDRIVRASLRVFAEKGFHRATMQDVVRESGLSVGAIYTWFGGKDELIRAGCDFITDQEMGELAARLEGVEGFRQRLATAIGFYFDQLDFDRAVSGGPRLLLEAWAAAETEPAIREMLQRRRREVVGAAVAMLHEGVARGEMPSWIEIGPLAEGFGALLDGVGLLAMEEGAGYRRADAERRVLAMIELLFAARAAERPARVEPVAPRPYASLRYGDARLDRRVS
jgi:AcrR family transcriptional regulator